RRQSHGRRSANLAAACGAHGEAPATSCAVHPGKTQGAGPYLTRRTRCVSESPIYTAPSGPTQMPWGRSIVADTPGPPSPEEPLFFGPLPATVEIAPLASPCSILRMTLFSVSAT